MPWSHFKWCLLTSGMAGAIIAFATPDTLPWWSDVAAISVSSVVIYEIYYRRWRRSL